MASKLDEASYKPIWTSCPLAALAGFRDDIRNEDAAIAALQESSKAISGAYVVYRDNSQSAGIVTYRSEDGTIKTKRFTIAEAILEVVRNKERYRKPCLNHTSPLGSSTGNGYFIQNVTYAEAKDILRYLPEGTYIVRRSNNPSIPCYVTTKNDDYKIIYEGGIFFFNLVDLRFFYSDKFEEMMEQVKTHYKLNSNLMIAGKATQELPAPSTILKYPIHQIDRHAAEKLLENEVEGTFIVRKSSSSEVPCSITRKTKRGVEHCQTEGKEGSVKLAINEIKVSFLSTDAMVEYLLGTYAGTFKSVFPKYRIDSQVNVGLSLDGKPNETFVLHRSLDTTCVCEISQVGNTYKIYKQDNLFRVTTLSGIWEAFTLDSLIEMLIQKAGFLPL